jgi:4-diphosphocytidyl-2C-methyl-D-erythritol kinase
MATKKQKMVDLKPKADKITEEHLNELQSVVSSINALQFEIGKIEAQKHELVHRLSGSQSRVAVLQDTFEKEYGSYDININDGTINRSKDGE